MTQDTAKIRIKLGTLEIDYEGSPEFLNGPLISMSEKLMSLYTTNRDAIKLPREGKKEETNPSNDNDQTSDHSTSTFAALINAQSGPELAKAAAANLTFTQKKDTFNRKELSYEMKAAPAYYKKTYLSNLTDTLNRLIKDDMFRQIGEQTYALSNKAKLEFEQKFAA
jgi:hypothetical protein